MSRYIYGGIEKSEGHQFEVGDVIGFALTDGEEAVSIFPLEEHTYRIEIFEFDEEDA